MNDQRPSNLKVPYIQNQWTNNDQVKMHMYGSLNKTLNQMKYQAYGHVCQMDDLHT